MTPDINRHNVGRIAERIVANELEFRGFRVSDLNKERTAANADLLAVAPGRKPVQIQVKGSSNGPKEWWVGYGYFTDEIVAGNRPVFNSVNSFYAADAVILVAVRTPWEYSCVILPIDIAQKAAELHLAVWRERERVWPRGKSSVVLELGPRAKDRDPRLTQERAILLDYRDKRGWERLLQSN